MWHMQTIRYAAIRDHCRGDLKDAAAIQCKLAAYYTQHGDSVRANAAAALAKPAEASSGSRILTGAERCAARSPMFAGTPLPLQSCYVGVLGGLTPAISCSRVKTMRQRAERAGAIRSV